MMKVTIGALFFSSLPALSYSFGSAVCGMLSVGISKSLGKSAVTERFD